MNSLKELIIPSVNAQGVDAEAQPTFGVLDVGRGSGVVGDVSLETDSGNTVEVGDVITVRVSVNTFDIGIQEYTIVVSYDPTKFTVIGDRATLLDTIFTIDNPETDNFAADGFVTVVASAESRLAVNSDVIEIQFEAQAPGTTQISVVNSGENPTILESEPNLGLDYTSNTLDIDVLTAQTEPDPDPTPEPTPQPIPNPTPQPTQPPEIPDTSISEVLPASMPILFGIFLLLLGSSLWKNKDKNKDSSINNH